MQSVEVNIYIYISGRQTTYPSTSTKRTDSYYNSALQSIIKHADSKTGSLGIPKWSHIWSHLPVSFGVHFGCLSGMLQYRYKAAPARLL